MGLGKELLQCPGNHGIQFLMMLLREKRRLLVQIRPYTNIEASLEGLIGSFAFFRAEGHILVHGVPEVGFQTIYVRPFIDDGITNPSNLPCKIRSSALYSTEPS